MGLFDVFKKKKNAETNMLNDTSYIADLRHTEGPWQQYDFLLASQGYGWDYILDSADYMTKIDLDQIGTVQAAKVPGGAETELIDEYESSGRSVKAMPSLVREGADLGIGGLSLILGAPLKIVWFNQTRVIRIYTPVNDEKLMTRYAQTLIRRTFATPDAMKLARPVKESSK